MMIGIAAVPTIATEIEQKPSKKLIKNRHVSGFWWKSLWQQQVARD